MNNLSVQQSYINDIASSEIGWPAPSAEADALFTNRDVFPGLDARTEQMLNILLDESFKPNQGTGPIRVKLALWVIRTKLNAKVKRIFDMVAAAGALVVLSPLLLITAVLIKLDSPGPVFYKQVRVGKGGKLFGCYKFRSMVVGADARKKELMAQNEADEVVFKIRKDPRITRVGRIIRKLSIDELPQLINVLQGSMSLVGPRPPVPVEVEKYQYGHFYRLDAVPGITGLQQVKGRSDITFKRWVQLDLEYIQEQSFWNDIKILLQTIPAVISGRGAY